MPAPSDLMLDPLPCPRLRLDARGGIVAVNAALCRLVGVPAEQVQGQAFDSLLTVAARVLYQSYLQPLLQLHGHVEEFSLSLKAAGGEPVDVLVYTSRAVEGDGIDMVLATIRQRRRIEDEMLRIKRAADQAPGLIFQLMRLPDGSQHFPYASEAIRHLYGVTAEAARATAENVFQHIDRDDRQAVDAAMCAAARQGQDWRGSYRVRLADGTLHWHEAQATPRQLANGVTLWHGHVADVTHRRSMESAVADKRAMERDLQARSEFLARVSHELRTPLNGILGFAQLLATDRADNLSAEQRDRLAVVRSSGQHLLDLINEVLDVTRLEAGQLSIPMSPLALRPQLEHALHLVEAQAQAAGVELQPLRCEPGLAAIANEQRLHQVLVNLLSNAIKYNRRGGTVLLSAAADVAGVRVAVQDTGLGLTLEQQSHLFQPFNRLGAERGSTEGSGLGLVISRHLLTLMGSDLVVHSQSGVGSTFSMHLRTAGVTEASAATRTVPPSPAARAAPAPGADVLRANLLYVEDNPVNAILMEAIVGMRPGLRLRVAQDGADALREAVAAPPDLLLLDMHLPDTDGIALLHALRERPTLRDIPAVAVSAAARSEDIERARAAGFAAYWTKPLDVDQTLAEIDRLLRA